MRHIFLASLMLSMLPPAANADTGPVQVNLTHPGDQPVGQTFLVRVEGYLPGGEGERRYELNGQPTIDPVRTPDWEIDGEFTIGGPVAAVGDAVGSRSGDSFFYRRQFSCTATGTATIGFDGDVDYSVVTSGGGVLRFGEMPFQIAGREFQCSAPTGATGGTITQVPNGSSVGHCDPKLLETEYGNFVGRIWREPGTDPMTIPDSMKIKTEVDNTFRSNRFNGANWDLSGDLWTWAGNALVPRHANNGHHPWLYVGSPIHPYRDEATFQCANADVAALVHLMTIRWPNPDDVNAPLREATLTCYVPPFKCEARREDK